MTNWDQFAKIFSDVEKIFNIAQQFTNVAVNPISAFWSQIPIEIEHFVKSFSFMDQNEKSLTFWGLCN